MVARTEDNHRYAPFCFQSSLCRCSLDVRVSGLFCCRVFCCLCSADGSTHTESNKLYRKVKHRYRPNLSVCVCAWPVDILTLNVPKQGWGSIHPIYTCIYFIHLSIHISISQPSNPTHIVFFRFFTLTRVFLFLLSDGMGARTEDNHCYAAFFSHAKRSKIRHFHRRFIYKGDKSTHAQGTDPTLLSNPKLIFFFSIISRNGCVYRRLS